MGEVLTVNLQDVTVVIGEVYFRVYAEGHGNSLNGAYYVSSNTSTMLKTFGCSLIELSILMVYKNRKEIQGVEQYVCAGSAVSFDSGTKLDVARCINSAKSEPLKFLYKIWKYFDTNIKLRFLRAKAILCCFVEIIHRRVTY